MKRLILSLIAAAVTAGGIVALDPLLNDADAGIFSRLRARRAACGKAPIFGRRSVSSSYGMRGYGNPNCQCVNCQCNPCLCGQRRGAAGAWVRQGYGCEDGVCDGYRMVYLTPDQTSSRKSPEPTLAEPGVSVEFKGIRDRFTVRRHPLLRQALAAAAYSDDVSPQDREKLLAALADPAKIDALYEKLADRGHGDLDSIPVGGFFELIKKLLVLLPVILLLL